MAKSQQRCWGQSAFGINGGLRLVLNRGKWFVAGRLGVPKQHQGRDLWNYTVSRAREPNMKSTKMRRLTSFSFIMGPCSAKSPLVGGFGSELPDGAAVH